MKKQLLVWVCILCLAVTGLLVSCTNGGDTRITEPITESTPTAEAEPTDTDSPEPISEPDAETETETETETEPETEPETLWDFAVEVSPDKDIKVLQLTDIQVIDSSQMRTPDRLVPYSVERWAKDTTEENYKKYVRQVIEQTQPDLIIMTGDLVYGEFDDSGSALLDLIDFMEAFRIPWAPVFGNHDNESTMGADWQCAQLENAEYCLFAQKTLTGNGNYSVAVTQNGVPVRVFYMLDSNGCGAASAESMANKHTRKTVGFGSDQVRWVSDSVAALREVYPDVKLSIACHIQPQVFGLAFEQYGYKPESAPVDLGTEGESFGYLGRGLKSPWDEKGTTYKKIKNLGFDSFFVGHEHCNSLSVMYEGVRLQYGQKSSTYDRANYRRPNGSVVGSYAEDGTPIIGGTLIPLGHDGSLLSPYIVLYTQP